MGIKNNAIKVAAVSMAVMMTTPTVAFSASFKDIPESFWAYDAVNSITSQGLMVGDLSGNFNPKAYIDKFNTSKILAKVLGYDYNNGSEQDKAYYDKIYNDKKTFLAQYAKAFAKWNSAADKEIAFLLEKGVLKNEDLNQFVIMSKQGKEQLRALSREEMAVFLVRIMGKEAEASKFVVTDKFSDDQNINATKKQSVYYLRSLGIISGNTDGKFNPNGAVTRADFCVLLNNTLKHMGKTVSVETTLNNQAGSNGAVVNNIETVVGFLDKYFPSLNVIQLSVGSEQKLYKVKSGADVKLDDFNSSLADLKEGMEITAVLNNTEVVQLSAKTVEEMTELVDITELGGESQEESTGLEQADSNEVFLDVSSSSVVEEAEEEKTSFNTITATISEEDLTMIVGSVEEVNSNSISLNYRMVNARDEINSQSKTYTFADNVVITKNGNKITAEEISVDDIASAKILGSKVYAIEVEGGNLALANAKLVKKYYNQAKNMPALVIEAENGKSYELFVTEDSKIKRNIDDETSWNDLKIGDVVGVTTNYNKIEQLSAMGEEKTLEGYVCEIKIGNEASYIGVAGDKNSTNSKLYTVDENTVDLYSIKIGDKVKMHLESEEVVTVNVRKSNEGNVLTGYITDVKSTFIKVEPIDSSKASYKKVEYDEDTIVMSSVSGKKLKIKELDDDMKVYVVFDDDDSEIAKTITVLSNN